MKSNERRSKCEIKVKKKVQFSIMNFRRSFLFCFFSFSFPSSLRLLRIGVTKIFFFYYFFKDQLIFHS